MFSSIRSRLALILLSAVIPLDVALADAPARCKYHQTGTLPLSYHGQDLVLASAGTINGTAAAIMLDTGATDSIITRFGADRRGLRPTATGDFGDGVGGASRLYTVPVRQFDVGPIRSSGRGSMKMIDQGGTRVDFDAIAGASFLLQADLELALADKKISFFRAENCRDAFLAYWDANAVQLPLGFTESGLPIVEIELDGLRLRALIDSGADSSNVSLEALGKLGLKAGAAGLEVLGHASGVGGKRVATWRYRFKQFSIGHEQIRHPELIVSAALPGDLQMILGRDFLRAHRVLLAPSQGKVYLSYLGGLPFDAGRSDGWLLKEAEPGNSAAQFRLALAAGVPEQQRAWMQKAVAAGYPLALRHRAVVEEQVGRHGEAIALRRQALQADPSDVAAQLELFSVRVKAGQGEAVRAELATLTDGSRGAAWPRPVLEHYLGKLSADQLLDAAGAQHRCEAYGYAIAWMEARADSAAAAALRARAATACPE